MKKSIYIFAILLFAACSTVPITGRQQIKIISSAELNAMAFQSYDEFLKNNKLSTDQKNVNLVKQVGNKIKDAVEEYLKANGQSNITQGFEWEFNLVEDKQVNAWAMPGGKVVFYSGIIPVCKDEDGVAVVMGHEIAHIIAGHGNERMSQGLMTEIGGNLVLSTLLKEKPEKTKKIFMSAYGLGAQVGVLLPFSRTHEKEADRLGLIFMTMAGYDPYEAPKFWEKMMEKSGGKEPPQFLSTHPSSESRVADLKSSIPEALTYKK
jgi:predicted Zn-dependent protease